MNGWEKARVPITFFRCKSAYTKLNIFSKFTKEKEELRIKKAGELSLNLRFDDFLQNLNRKRTLKLQGLFGLGDLSPRAVKGSRAVH